MRLTPPITLCFPPHLLGSFNSISNKLADRESAKGTTDESHEFNHPYVQSLAMFIGEVCNQLSSVCTGIPSFNRNFTLFSSRGAHTLGSAEDLTWAYSLSSTALVI